MDKIINDVLLKSLTFQTGQKKWDGGSNMEWGGALFILKVAIHIDKKLINKSV